MADETNALQNEDIQHLLERGEAAGFLESTDVSEVLDTLELDQADIDLVNREIEERNIELVEVVKEPPREPTAPPRASAPTGRLAASSMAAVQMDASSSVMRPCGRSRASS